MIEGGSTHTGGSAIPPQAPAESSRANSRAALLDAAFEEFSSKGYESATVAGIAERAGVTTGALYAHFKGKLDLLLEVLGMRAPEDVFQSVAGLGDQSWTEAAKLLGEAMAMPPEGRTLLLLDVIVVARRDPYVAKILRSGLESYLDAMKRATDAGIVLGLVDPSLGPDDLARVLTIMALGMIVFRALDERPPSDQAFQRLADLLLQSAGAEKVDDQAAALTRVRARAATLDQARVSLQDAIVDAIADGQTLRRVGEAAGMSHERVRQVLREREAGAT